MKLLVGMQISIMFQHYINMVSKEISRYKIVYDH